MNEYRLNRNSLSRVILSLVLALLLSTYKTVNLYIQEVRVFEKGVRIAFIFLHMRNNYIESWILHTSSYFLSLALSLFGLPKDNSLLCIFLNMVYLSFFLSLYLSHTLTHSLHALTRTHVSKIEGNTIRQQRWGREDGGDR